MNLPDTLLKPSVLEAITTSTGMEFQFNYSFLHLESIVNQLHWVPSSASIMGEEEKVLSTSICHPTACIFHHMLNFTNLYHNPP